MGLQAWRRLIESYRGSMSYQALAQKAGMSKGALSRLLIEGDYSVQHSPELPTMQKLGEVLGLPLHIQIEALGFDLGYTKDDAETARIVRQVRARPELSKLLVALLDMEEVQIAYVRGLAQKEQR